MTQERSRHLNILPYFWLAYFLYIRFLVACLYFVIDQDESPFIAVIFWICYSFLRYILWHFDKPVFPFNSLIFGDYLFFSSTQIEKGHIQWKRYWSTDRMRWQGYFSAPMASLQTLALYAFSRLHAHSVNQSLIAILPWRWISWFVMQDLFAATVI